MRLILICIALIGTLVSSALAHTGVGQTDFLCFGDCSSSSRRRYRAWLFFAERSTGKVTLRAMGELTLLGGIALIGG